MKAQMQGLASVTKVRITMDLELTDQEMETLHQLAEVAGTDIPDVCQAQLRAYLHETTEEKVNYPLEPGQWFTRGYELPFKYQEWLEEDAQQDWLDEHDTSEDDGCEDEDPDEYNDYDEYVDEGFPIDGDPNWGPAEPYPGGDFDHGYDPPESDDDYGDHPPYFGPCDDPEDPDPPGCHPDEIVQGWVDKKNAEQAEYDGCYEGDLRSALKGRRLGTWDRCSTLHSLAHILDADWTNNDIAGRVMHPCGAAMSMSYRWHEVDYSKPIFEGSVCPQCLEALRRNICREHSESPLGDVISELRGRGQ